MQIISDLLGSHFRMLLVPGWNLSWKQWKQKHFFLFILKLLFSLTKRKQTEFLNDEKKEKNNSDIYNVFIFYLPRFMMKQPPYQGFH